MFQISDSTNEEVVLGQLCHALDRLVDAEKLECAHRSETPCKRATCLLLNACMRAMTAPTRTEALDCLMQRDVRQSTRYLADCTGEHAYRDGLNAELRTSMLAFDTVLTQPTTLVTALRECQQTRREALALLCARMAT